MGDKSAQIRRTRDKNSFSDVFSQWINLYLRKTVERYETKHLSVRRRPIKCAPRLSELIAILNFLLPVAVGMRAKLLPLTTPDIEVFPAF